TGGEPSLHPHFAHFVRKARELELDIEVYTNLFSLPQKTLDLYKANSVSVATSFYDVDADITARITRRASAHARLVQNIQRVIEAGLPMRVGVIRICDDQDVASTLELLRRLGVENPGED